MYITSSDQLRHPFSLTCRDCDAGTEMETPEQAIAAGWIEIEEVSEENLMEAFYLGVCPDCQDVE